MRVQCHVINTYVHPSGAVWRPVCHADHTCTVVDGSISSVFMLLSRRYTSQTILPDTIFIVAMVGPLDVGGSVVGNSQPNAGRTQQRKVEQAVCGCRLCQVAAASSSFPHIM